VTLILFGLLTWGAVNVGILGFLVLARRGSGAPEVLRVPESPAYTETLAS